MVDFTNKRRTVCYTCEVAREYINRTPVSRFPTDNTWTTQLFLSGLENDQKLGAFGDAHILTEQFLIALIEDTEKYHRNLSPKLHVVLQSTLSRSQPRQILPPGPRNSDATLAARVYEYFEEIRGVPKIFMVSSLRPLRITYKAISQL